MRNISYSGTVREALPGPERPTLPEGIGVYTSLLVWYRLPDGIQLGLEKRLQERYRQLVKAHMHASTRTAPGPRSLLSIGKSTTASQAVWRFLNNERVSLKKLIEPLRQLGREGCAGSTSSFVLLAHDWCKLGYGSQSRRKKDLLQLTHQEDIGYDLSTSLLIEADSGITLAPMQIHLKTADAVHSTAEYPPQHDDHHLDQLEPTMEEATHWDLPRRVVHVIDREANSLGRLRQWHAQGHLFLVRCDDRRVLCDGQSVLLSELNERLDRDCLFEDAGKARYHGKNVRREVAEKTIVLHRPHSAVVDGKKRTVTGEPLEVRAVFVRLVDAKDWILAEWMLLTNVPADEADAAEVGKWYYFRWRIESFFKLLKSHGHELEYWQQESGLAIAKRLLVAAMACMVVKQLEASQSEAAAKFRRYLIRLSGRRMKHKVESTAPALLAGYYVHLTMTDYLEQSELTIDELKSLEKIALKELQLV